MLAKFRTFTEIFTCSLLLAFLCVSIHSSPALAQSSAAKASASNSRQVFEYLEANGKLPDPGSLAVKSDYQELDKLVDKFVNKYSKRNELTLTDLEELGKDAAAPLELMYQIQKKIEADKGKSKPAGTAGTCGVAVKDTVMVIPPKAMVEWTSRGNCMDPDRPAPSTNDKFKLIPISELFPAELVPVYEGFMKLTMTNAQARSLQQHMVWALRTTNWANSRAANLKPEHRALLDKSYPNGAAIVERLAASAQAKDTAKKVLNFGLGKVGGQLGQLAQLGFSVNDTQQHLQHLIQTATPAGQNNSGYEYSAIAGEVYTKVVGTGALEAKFIILNASSAPYEFRTVSYAAEAQRKTQRVSMIPPSGKIACRKIAAEGGGGSRDLDIQKLKQAIDKMNKAIASKSVKPGKCWKAMGKFQGTELKNLDQTIQLAVHMYEALGKKQLSASERKTALGPVIAAVSLYLEQLSDTEAALNQLNDNARGFFQNLRAKGLAGLAKDADKAFKDMVICLRQEFGKNAAKGSRGGQLSKKEIKVIEKIADEAGKAGYAVN